MLTTHKEKLALIDLGERVRNLITDRGFTLRAFCIANDISKDSMNNIVNAKSGVSIVQLSRIAKALGIPLVELLRGVL